MRPDIFTVPVVDAEGDGVIVIRHDARELPLVDDSVDLVVTSPPFFALRSYRDDGEHYDGQLGSEDTPTEFVDNLVACMGEWVRVLKPSGSIWVNLGDKYAGTGGANSNTGLGLEDTGTDTHDSRSSIRNNTIQSSGFVRAKSLMGLPWRFALACIDQLDLILRAEVIWSKPNGLPESVTDRVRRSHEQWFHFVLEPRYFSGVDEIREPQKILDRQGETWTNENIKRDTDREAFRYASDLAGERVLEYNPLGRLPGSVWTIPSEPLLVPDQVRTERGLPDHFAAFPQEWPRRIIQAWTPVGYCEKCDQSRRVVVDKTTTGVDNRAGGEMRAHNDQEVRQVKHGSRNPRQVWGDTKATNPDSITGYDCECPAPEAPTRPAVVLDPFGGTGTTAGVARTLGRYGITNDLSQDYNRLAAWRILESGHFTKTEQRAWRDRQTQLL